MSGCTGCGEDYETNRDKTTWWNCQHYYGFSGHFCGECYDMIRHDSYRQPINPAGFVLMLLKLGIKHDNM